MFEVEAGNAKRAVDTLQGVAQQKVDALTQQLADETLAFNNANDVVGKLQATVDSDAAQIADLKAQLAAQPSALPVVYDRLEFKPWRLNSDPNVGGSGLGTSAQTQPGIETAEFSIKPQAGQYYDVYCTLDFPVDDTKTHYRLTTDWMFPTLADANASQCLEMEARQVVNGKMIIVACQLQFSGNHLRYWDATTKWTASATAQPRLVPGAWYTVALEGHRDADHVYHDSITINGIKTVLNTSYVAQATTWRTMMRCALQLDGNGRGDAYRVKRANTKFEVWA